MTLLKGKHIEKEIEGVRCRVVETGASENRVKFLRALLEHNGYEVKVEEEAKVNGEDPTTYVMGVTDIIFNPVVAVYQRMLNTQDGRKVTPAYWNQQSEETHPDYWDFDPDLEK